MQGCDEAKQNPSDAALLSIPKLAGSASPVEDLTRTAVLSYGSYEARIKFRRYVELLADHRDVCYTAEAFTRFACSQDVFLYKAPCTDESSKSRLAERIAKLVNEDSTKLRFPCHDFDLHGECPELYYITLEEEQYPYLYRVTPIPPSGIGTASAQSGGVAQAHKPTPIPA
jgi:hypothetical protein